MESTETNKIEILRETFAQYWQHVRHQETQRLSFINTFSVIAVGVFTLIFTEFLKNQTGAQILLLGLVILLAVIGILATMSWRIAYLEYKSIADKALELNGINLADFVAYAERPRRKPMSAHLAFLCFYDLIMTVAVALILWLSFRKELSCLILVLSSLALLIFVIITYSVNTHYEKCYLDQKEQN
jgi:hypothetical protein